MRLINTKTLQLEDVGDTPPVPYAILSHTWGPDEVLFADLRNDQHRTAAGRVDVRVSFSDTAGYRKVSRACELAKGQGLGYLWADTCCIDKTSSAELNAAVNAMFGWYRGAAACYALLSDVTVRPGGGIDGSGGGAGSEAESETGFAASRWFTRGWTLQELLAPADVDFFDSEWRLLGRRSTLSARISRITGISEALLVSREAEPATTTTTTITTMTAGERTAPSVEPGLAALVPGQMLQADWLQSQPSQQQEHLQLLQQRQQRQQQQKRRRLPDIAVLLQQENVATRMSWMAQRSTTRPEDMAYCLLGLFDVNMPLLYGEGGAKAFFRLQEEILRTTQDHSMLVWRATRTRLADGTTAAAADVEEAPGRMHYLASSPCYFNLRTYDGQENPMRFEMQPRARGLQVRVWKCPVRLTLRNRAGETQTDDDGRWLAVLDCSLSPDTLSRPAILLRAGTSGVDSYRRSNLRVIMVIEPRKSGFLMMGDDDGGEEGDEGKIQAVEYDPGDLKRETILLENAAGGPAQRGAFPFKVNLPRTPGSLSLGIQQRAAYMGARRFISAGHISYASRDNPIYGVVFFGDGAGREFLVWWGLVELGSAMSLVLDDRNAPRLWDSSIPVCFVQAWSNLTGTRAFAPELAEALAVDMLDEELRLPGPRRRGTGTVATLVGGAEQLIEVEDGFDLGPPAPPAKTGTGRSSSMSPERAVAAAEQQQQQQQQQYRPSERPMSSNVVIGLFTQCARPVMEVTCAGVRVKASMQPVEFLERQSCELTVEIS